MGNPKPDQAIHELLGRGFVTHMEVICTCMPLD